MNFLNDLIPQEYIQALGWTLLHSIWQAAAIALLVGILMIFLQRSSKIRYIVAASAMPLVLIFALATFYFSFDSAVKSTYPTGLESKEVFLSRGATTGLEIEAVQANSQETSFLAQFTAYFTNHFPLIITLWFLGILVLTLRFLGGLAYVQRLKKYKVVDITPQWESRIKSISQRIGLDKSVQLLESSLVTVPMVVGYLKPVILLPIGAITGLSPSQVESILAHELAHIVRKDYLVNIIQTVIEILFFYHPAIWWISGRIREERENCCDDIAVQINENTLIYAKALTTLGEMHVQNPRMAMAATGNSGILFKRIKRMLTKPTQHSTFSEGFITACALFICIFCFSLVARASLSTSFYEPTTTSITDVTEMDSHNEGEFSAILMNVENASGDDDNLIIVKDKKGQIVELYVNGKKVPSDEIKNYEHLIQESLIQQKDQESIGNKFSAEDEKALNNLVEELNEESKSIISEKGKEKIKDQDHIDKIREKRIIINRDSGDVINSFVQKTLEIARIGMEIGSVNLELESLKRRMSRIDDEEKQNLKPEIKRLEKKIAELEAKAEKLGHDIESSGEDIGKWSLDFSSSILDSIMDGFNLDFHWSEDEEDEEQ